MISYEDKIKQRLKKSGEALDDAVFLMDAERYMSAVNRMYYAAFYAITAYFAYQNILVKTHKGINVKMHEELVSKNIIDKKDSDVFDMLFKLRGEFDYGDFAVIETQEIKQLYSQTEAFINKLKTLILIND